MKGILAEHVGKLPVKTVLSVRGVEFPQYLKCKDGKQIISEVLMSTTGNS